MQPVHPIGRRPLLPGTPNNLFYPPERNEYNYFELPFDAGNSLVRASWAADAAMLAYARFGETRMTGAELETCLASGGLQLRALIGDWNANGTQGFFAANNDIALLSFRGTEKDDPIDQIDDADLVLVPEPPAFCFVHQGFKRALDRVWAQVHPLVAAYRQTNPNAEICFTGHSLGAALATIAFSRVRDNNLSLITIGSPRVGNAAFRDRVLGNMNRAGIQRFMNENDAVTHIPLAAELFYCHVPSTCLRFDAAGVLSETPDTDLVVPNLIDHSPARYCVRLLNLSN
jgi:triacylglycerol lipase